MPFLLPDPTEAEYVRGGDDPALKVLGRSTQEAELQQEVVRDPQRIFLLQSCQPVPLRRSQGGVGQEMWHHSVSSELKESATGPERKRLTPHLTALFLFPG